MLKPKNPRRPTLTNIDFENDGESEAAFEREFLEKLLAHHQAQADADKLEFESRVIEDLTEKNDDYMGPDGKGYWPFAWPIGEHRTRALSEVQMISPGYEWSEVIPKDKQYTLSWEGTCPITKVKRLANLTQCRESVWVVVADETSQWEAFTFIWEKYPVDELAWRRSIRLGEDLELDLTGPLPVGEIDAQQHAVNAVLASIADVARE